MEEDILNLVSNISIENLEIAIIVFLITMIVKIPIKKSTSKLEEGKRKIINSFIVLIPLALSIIINFLFKERVNVVERSLNCFVVALSIHGIYQRIVEILKAKKSSKEEVIEVKESIKNLLVKLKIDRKELKEVKEKEDRLIEDQSNLNKDNLLAIFNKNIEIEKLRKEERELEEDINESKQEIKILKGEENEF